MRVWWLKGYHQGVLDLSYAAHVTYGECMAHKAALQLEYPNHVFIVREGVV